MNNQLQTFAFQSHQLRIETDDNGEPLFHANDLCAILGYSNPHDALAKHVPACDIAKCEVTSEEATGKQRKTQMVNFLREPGMWSLIMRSNAANALPVQRWVVEEVLPTIRKTGSYGTPDALTIPSTLTPSQFERTQAALLEAQEALNRATIQMSVGEYEALLDQKMVYHVPGKALALMEKYGIPRDEICQAAGINRNNLRQHLHHVAKQGGAA